LQNKDPENQVAILLHVAGAEAQEIHNAFVYENADHRKDYVKVLQQFSNYCEPRKNIVFERYMFWERSQLADEPVDQWITDLRLKAGTCEFRLGILPLRIETGRFTREKIEDRICPICTENVEDEYHFMFHCALYKDCRKELHDSVRAIYFSFDNLEESSKLNILMQNCS